MSESQPAPNSPPDRGPGLRTDFPTLRLVKPSSPNASSTGLDAQREDAARRDAVVRSRRWSVFDALASGANHPSAGATKEVVAAVRAARELDEAIVRSRSILDLCDDWDEAGAVGYKEETWARARAFLRRHAAAAMAMGSSIGVPRILPGPEGSIDLHWRSADFEILLNVPEEESRPVEFYGDDHSGSVLRGTLGLGPDSKPALLPWLIHR